MKKNVVTISIVVFSVLFFLLPVACNFSSESNVSRYALKGDSYLTMEDAFGSLFNGGSGRGAIIVPSLTTPEYFVYEMDPLEFSFPRIKTRSEGPGGDGDGWVDWGKACNKLDAIKFANKCIEVYGSRCYEMKAGETDRDGCRMMSHRPCR